MAWPKGKPRPPQAGRKKGTPNKQTAEVREAVMGAFNELGGQSYLVEIGRQNPAVFIALLGKLLPPEQPAPAPGNNVLVLRWVTPEIAQARGMIEMTANSKEPGQD